MFVEVKFWTILSHFRFLLLYLILYTWYDEIFLWQIKDWIFMYKLRVTYYIITSFICLFWLELVMKIPLYFFQTRHIIRYIW